MFEHLSGWINEKVEKNKPQTETEEHLRVIPKTSIDFKYKALIKKPDKFLLSDETNSFLYLHIYFPGIIVLMTRCRNLNINTYKNLFYNSIS